MIKVLPGDSREDVAKRVALSAIGLLQEVIDGELDRDSAATALEMFHIAWQAEGVNWTRPDERPLNLDEWLTAAEMADLVEVAVPTIRQWRHRGHISTRWCHTRKCATYNVGEVLAYQRRQREARARNRQRTRC